MAGVEGTVAGGLSRLLESIGEQIMVHLTCSSCVDFVVGGFDACYAAAALEAGLKESEVCQPRAL